jgi:hypothetical protein
MKKYVFLRLKVQNGEYEYSNDSVHQLPEELKPEEFADLYASEFYAGKSEKVDDYYYFNGGEVAVKVREITEITEKEYGILNKYI